MGRVLHAALAASLAYLLPAATGAQSPPKPWTAPLTAYASPAGRAKTTARETLARLRVPAGFRVTVFAEGLGNPRMLAVGDDGTVYVTRRDSNDVLALRDDGTGKAGAPRKVVTDLDRVHGIALHGGRMYLATVKELYEATMGADGSVGEPRAIVADLPDGGQHPNRTIGVGPDGMLYVSVGSTCNRCNETNSEAATIVRMKPDGSMRGILASGLRNTVGWTWHPETRELWGFDHGSDWTGNDRPPEELNLIQPASHYGWPWCYANREPDSLFTSDPQGSAKDEFCPRTVAPVLTYQAHSAPIQLAFYTGTQFPQGYRNDLFVAMRGSWNRDPATGYKVVRVRYANGKPTAAEDFLTGFLSPDRKWYYGRLAGLAVARDGSLLVGDDTNGVIYRVAYVGGAAGAPGGR